jgi:glycosyltransferase involved in cell wall biosynthesis
MRRVTGLKAVDVVPNGVDCDAYAPRPADPAPRSAVFWGRLSFAPNARAIRWFCTRVWPLVRAHAPDAQFTILGSDPPEDVARRAGRDGITLLADLPDLRDSIARHEVVVMPFISGGGIKNKVLEAAAMAKPIVATPKALLGLRTPPPVVIARSPTDFAAAVLSLWTDAVRRQQLGRDARDWVRTTHTWAAAARDAVRGLEASLHDRAPRSTTS